jgi:hypothetical protein
MVLRKIKIISLLSTLALSSILSTSCIRTTKPSVLRLNYKFGNKSDVLVLSKANFDNFLVEIGKAVETEDYKAFFDIVSILFENPDILRMYESFEDYR